MIDENGLIEEIESIRKEILDLEKKVVRVEDKLIRDRNNKPKKK